MKTRSGLLIALLLVLTGCGEREDSGARDKPPARDDAAVSSEQSAQAHEDRMKQRPRAASGKGATITLRDSEFGTMLFDSRRQAIYIFQRDRNKRTVCYGECAKAWPPVLTDGNPAAGRGVRQALLGTIERRDGKQQVTYAGKPLYFYAHERPGEVRCHNVDLNGGLWWVIGADGKRRG